MFTFILFSLQTLLQNFLSILMLLYSLVLRAVLVEELQLLSFLQRIDHSLQLIASYLASILRLHSIRLSFITIVFLLFQVFHRNVFNAKRVFRDFGRRGQKRLRAISWESRIRAVSLGFLLEEGGGFGHALLAEFGLKRRVFDSHFCDIRRS